MIKLRFIISILLFIIMETTLPTFAGEYKVLVLPNSSIDITKKNTIGNVDIEEMLAKKIISRLEETGMACAPTIEILRIGILNNPYFQPKASNPLNNAKIISDSYKVPKVIIVSSKVIVKSPNEQKEFWKALNIPAIYQTDANFQLVTTVNVYDMNSEQILWSDVYQQNLNSVSEGIKSTQINTVNSYYDELTEKLIKDMKATKSTSAVLLSDKIPNMGKPLSNDTMVSSSEVVDITSQQQIVHPPVTKVNLGKTPKENSLVKIRQGINKKISDYRKAMKNRDSKELNKRNEKIIQKSEDKKQAVKTKKEGAEASKNKESFTKKIVNSIEKNKQKINNYIEKRNIEKAGKLVQEKKKPIENIKEEKRLKTALNKEEKTRKKSNKLSKINEKIKDKVADIKQTYMGNKNKQIGLEENALKYTINTVPSIDDEFNVNNYIQIKPRNNAWNYTPKFNSFVNDI